MSDFIVSTTFNAGSGQHEVVGSFASQSVRASNFVKDFFAGIRDTFGGRSRGYDKAIQEATNEVILDLKRQAQSANPRVNALVGLQVSVFPVGGSKMIGIHAIATAVIVHEQDR